MTRRVERAALERSVAGNVQLVACLPNFGAALDRSYHLWRDWGWRDRHWSGTGSLMGCWRVRTMGVGKIHSTCHFAACVDNPRSVNSTTQRQKVVLMLGVRSSFGGKIIQAVELGFPEIRNEYLALLVGDFEWPREPQSERPVHERIAEEKQEYDRQQRNSHCPRNHFRLEARAHLVAASLGPKPQEISRKDEREDEQRRRDERRECKENQKRIVLLGMQRNLERAEREHRGGQHGYNQSANCEPQLPFPLGLLLPRAHRPSSRYRPSGHSSHFGCCGRHHVLPAFTISA